MTEALSLSPNTKAILLLTAPLIAGRTKRSEDILTPGEYKRLARHLREVGAEPADLLTPQANHVLDGCGHVIDRDRLERLLGRGFLLSQAVERWHAKAIWVLSRADAAYPRRLKTLLGGDTPAVLYGCGERELLDTGGLAVVGSRNVDEKLIDYTQEIGRLAASAGRTLVSGGARGIDQASMRGALEAGGRVTGVLADSLEKTVMNRENRNLLMEGRLVLISPQDPGAGFNVGHAMQRNKLIYALADAALVVSTDANKGGTWAGATEQLQKLRLVPVYVRSTGDASKGLEALIRKGALPWPNPEDAEGLEAALSAPAMGASARQSELLFTAQQDAGKAGKADNPRPGADERATRVSEAGTRAVDNGEPAREAGPELFQMVRRLVLRLVQEPRQAAEIAKELDVTKRQAEQWLQRLMDEGALVKQQEPVRYVVRQGRPVP